MSFKTTKEKLEHIFDTKEDIYPFPVIEEIEFDVAAQEIEITKDFRYISRLIFKLRWASTAPNWALFGGDAALTNGLQIRYRGELILPHGIKNNTDFAGLSYDTQLEIDNAATKNCILYSRLSFTRFTNRRRGLRVDNNKRFAIVVQDDLSGTGNDVSEVYIEGWKYHV